MPPRSPDFGFFPFGFFKVYATKPQIIEESIEAIYKVFEEIDSNKQRKWKTV